jgi:hypothetical protein
MAKLIGNAPNQISTNGDLGSMAFEDKKNYATTSSPIHQPFRNIIINGDMSIAQRGTSETGITSGGYLTVDRQSFVIVNQGTFTMSQETDVPSGQGFTKSLKFNCTTADASPTGTDRLYLSNRFEGQNLQYLKKGTANATSLTLSFWVKSNKTGTYIAELFDNDNTRQISQAYTINSSNTWEKKTLTYEGDTSGALDNDNNNSLELNLWFGGGSTFTGGTLNTSWNANVNNKRASGVVNLADSTSNEWYITGVQLEAGTTASDFEFLPYDVNLERCQRYYQVFVEGNGNYFMNGHYYYSTNVRGVARFFKPMRASATLDMVTGTDYYKIFRDSGNDLINSFTAIANNQSSILYNSTEASGTAGQAGDFITNNASAFIAFDAEL